jgi:hypothetical protein
VYLRRLLAIACIITAGSAVPAGAQDRVTGGIIGGVTSSALALTGSDVSTLNSPYKPGFYAGAFVGFAVADLIAVRPEAAWSSRRFTVDDPHSPFTAHESWNWLEVPVLLHIGRMHGGYVVAGPALNILVSAKEDTTVGETDRDVKDQLNGSTISIVGGAGFAGRHLGFEVRYDGGLENLNHSLIAPSDEIKTRSVHILGRWTFN